MTLLRRRLCDLAASSRPLVVELDQVSFIDSAGIGALVGAAKRAAEYGGSLSVVCAQPKIWRLFRLVGVDTKIPLARSLDEALEKLGGGPDHTRLISSLHVPQSGTVLDRQAGHDHLRVRIQVRPQDGRCPFGHSLRPGTKPGRLGAFGRVTRPLSRRW